MLHIISNQIGSLSTDIKSLSKDSTSSKFPQSFSAPHFQPRSLPKTQEDKLTLGNNSLLNKLTQTLDSLN